MKLLLEFLSLIAVLGGVVLTLGAAALTYVPFGELASLASLIAGCSLTAAMWVVLACLVRIAYRGRWHAD